MRLGRTCLATMMAASLLVLASAPASGEDGETQPAMVVGRANLYQDDDKTTVLTLLTEGSGTVGALALRAGVLIDAQSSASVDVVSNATPATEPRYSEPRLEFSSSATYRLDLETPLTMSGGYIFSNEHDYRSHTVSVGSSIELFQRNSTLSVGYSLGLDQIWRGGIRRFSDDASNPPAPNNIDPFFASRDKKRHGVDLSWSQVLARHTVGAVAYSLTRESGFLSSPYRFVSTSDGAFRTREVHPDRRTRHAVGLRLRRYLFRDAAVEGTYRFYGDGWGLFSNTVGAALLWQLRSWLELDLHDRFYWQTDADFYRPSYDQPEELMSGDKELSRLWDNMVGLRAGILLGSLGPLERLRLDAKFDWLRVEYSNFPLRPRLNAYISQLGVVADI